MSKVLIVDDSPTDSYLAQKCAGELFDEVKCVSNVDELFSVLGIYKPSLILMDLTLDDVVNGISLICQIRSAEDDLNAIPIVVLSSRKMPVDMNNAKLAGASGYLVKPVSVDALKQIALEVISDFKPKVKPVLQVS